MASKDEHTSEPGAQPARPRGSGRGVPPEIREEILRLVAAGHNAVDIAAQFGVHSGTISKWKRRERERLEAVSQSASNSSAPQPDAQSSAKDERECDDVSESASSSSTPQPDGDGQSGAEDDVASPGPTGVLPETGRYSMEFKNNALGQVLSGRKIVDVAAQYSVPEGTIGRWLREARANEGEIPEPKSTRPPPNTSPINPEHRRLVLELKSRRPNVGPAQIQSYLKRFHALKLSRQMIGRILVDAGFPLQKRSSKQESSPEENRFEMSRPNELWAVDFTEFWIQSEKAYVLLAIDDYSRFCVGFALTEKPTADLAIETVELAVARYGRPERILSDRGPQFHAWNAVSRFDQFLDQFLTDHTVTKARHAFTNGKIEALIRTLSVEVLEVEEFASLQEAAAAIGHWVGEYNFLRVHSAIGGLVPADRYFGMVEEAQRALEEGLKKAGPGLAWLQGLVSVDGVALRAPKLLELLFNDGKVELVVLGRRFTLAG